MIMQYTANKSAYHAPEFAFVNPKCGLVALVSWNIEHVPDASEYVLPRNSVILPIE
jgi:hypothetical protein